MRWIFGDRLPSKAGPGREAETARLGTNVANGFRPCQGVGFARPRLKAV